MKILETGDRIYRYHKSVVIKFSGKRAVLSTGVLNGGYSEAMTAVFNNDAKSGTGMGCQLKAPTYEEHMRIIAQELGLNPDLTTGISTAADMENMSITVEKYGDLSVTALITAGIETNGGRAGDPASYVENNGKTHQVKQGTINIIVGINKHLPPRTLTRAIVTITEAKAAAIQELLEGSKYSSGIATGSGTDGVIVFSDIESQDIYNDAGKHSKLGELIGVAVKKGMKVALARQSGLTPEKQKSIFRRTRRYKITAETVWDKYIEKHPEDINKKLEFMEFIDIADKNEKVVALTSLYLHLLDQLEWGLLSEKCVREECEEIRELICNRLGIDYDLEDGEISSLRERFILTLVKFTEEKWED